LDAALWVGPKLTKEQLLDVMCGHILAEEILIGTDERA
jgi:hypothetical protein